MSKEFIVLYAPQTIIDECEKYGRSAADAFQEGFLDDFVVEKEKEFDCRFCGIAPVGALLFRLNKQGV